MSTLWHTSWSVSCSLTATELPWGLQKKMARVFAFCLLFCYRSYFLLWLLVCCLEFDSHLYSQLHRNSSKRKLILKINRWRFSFKTLDLLWVLLDTIYLNIVLLVEMPSCSWRAFVCWTFSVFLSFPNTQTTSKECLTPRLGQAPKVKCQCDKRMVLWENFS